MVIVIVPNVFMNYLLGAVRVEDRRFKDWDHYKFTIWQSQLNFTVFCASSACGVSVEHLNAKEPMMRSIYRFHVYYHVRRILKILEIPLPYENSFNQYNNPYNHEKFIGICSEYGLSNDLTKWRNQINKTNDLILNLTPENVTQHSRIVTTTRKGSSTPTKMSKIIGRQIH